MEKDFVLNRIEELRKQKGLSYYALAKRSGLYQSSLFVIMHRRSTPTFYTLDKICEGLGVTLEEFFTVGKGLDNLTPQQRYIAETYESFDDEKKELAKQFILNLIAKRKAEEEEKEKKLADGKEK